MNESFFVRGPAGRLEALLMNPKTPPVAAAVVCHAHPQHGGMMHFKAVYRAAKALQLSGLVALRFNFRGVGRSQGTYDHGEGEQDDARAALAYLEHRFSGLPLVLGGFSFGSVVALRVAARDRRVKAVFALGYPSSTIQDEGFLASITVPRFFVQGERDVYGPREALRAVIEPLAPPRELVTVPSADHFFAGHLGELQSAVARWARTRPWATATPDPA